MEESDRLIRILKNFCRITDNTFPESFSTNPITKLSETLSEINEKLKHQKHINLMKDDCNKLHLVFEKDVMDYYTIYFIPLEKTYTECFMTEKFGNIVRRFIATFANNNRFDTINNTRTFNYFEEIQEDLELSEDEEGMDVDAVKNYSENSEAGEALSKLDHDIHTHPFTAQELFNYSPEEKEQELYDILCEGIEFCFPNIPFTQYCGTFNEDEYQDMIVAIDDVILVTYYQNSVTEDSYVDSINEECNGGYGQMRVLSSTELTEDMTEITSNDYAERFLKFVDKLSNQLYSY